MTFDVDSSLRLIHESLRLAELLGADPIDARSVRMVDQTLVVEIVVASADPIAVRGEVVGVMGVLSGLDIPASFPALGAQRFGVRVFDPDGAELLWVISSLAAATFAGAGQPVEWLSRSWIQDNTPAYRRAQADRLIGQLETALRDLLDRHATQILGDNYLEQLWPAAAVREMYRRAGREGADSSEPRAVLDFTYLPDLRDAIVAHFAMIDDGCIHDADEFSESIRRLNGVRRKVAHHRLVTESDLAVTKESSGGLLRPIGAVHAEFAQDFVVDRWEEQVQRIFAVAVERVQSPVVPDRGDVPEPERRTAAAEALDTQLSGIEEALEAMAQLVVPPQRRELHERATAALETWRDGLADLARTARQPDLTIAEAQDALEDYKRTLAEVEALRHRIQALTVGLSETADA